MLWMFLIKDCIIVQHRNQHPVFSTFLVFSPSIHHANTQQICVTWHSNICSDTMNLNWAGYHTWTVNYLSWEIILYQWKLTIKTQKNLIVLFIRFCDSHATRETFTYKRKYFHYYFENRYIIFFWFWPIISSHGFPQ